MIKNYFKSALRSLLKERTNTFINIAGLTLGITGSLVLFLIVKDGRSYDDFHTKHDRIYRVVSRSMENGRESFTQGVPAVMPAAFRNDFSAAEAVAFTSYRRQSLITVPQANGETKKYEEPSGVAITEPSFFKIFDRPMLIGSAATGLDEPNEALISRKWALKYFGKENATGETVRYGENEYRITGVMEDFPTNTDFPFELVLSYSTIQKTLDGYGWGSISDTENCYFLLKEDQPISRIEAGISGFAKKYYGEGDANQSNKTFVIQTLKEIHTDNRFGNYNKKMPVVGQIAFGVIGIFLIITACINFINLTTAEAIKRTREVGIRKVLGSSRTQLIMKFLGESFLVTFAAVLLSLAGAQLMLGFLNPFLDLSLTLQLTSDGMLWIFLAALTTTVTLVSGLYPAVVVSAFKPVLALQNRASSRSGTSFNMRRGLIVFQFFISQFFIIGTIVLLEQIDYVQHQDIGFAKDAIITLPIPVTSDASAKTHMRTLKNELLRVPGIEQVTLNSSPPSSNGVSGSSFTMEGSTDEINTQIKQVDGDYIDLFHLTLVAGEKLDDHDSLTTVVVNETLVKAAGISSPADMIGKDVSIWGKKLSVKGVVKDFHTQSLEKAIEPVMLFNNTPGYSRISLKLKPQDMQATIHNVQTKWEAAYPEYIFSYQFLDEQIKNLYNGERKTSVMLGLFSSIAIFIGCLGLFGLVTFMANQKTKEIGVRKVLGASVESIMLLFSREFVRLILIGFVLAAPGAWFLMREILAQFAYRITIGPGIFIGSLAITFFIATLTVGFRSFRAAVANPVRSLRSE